MYFAFANLFKVPIYAHAASKYIYTPIASIKSILDSVDFFLENLAKFSSSCVYMLPMSYFFVVFKFRKEGQIVWCIRCHKSIFESNPDRRVNIWEHFDMKNYAKAL